MKVAAKELKSRLAHYLRLVQEGEAVQVTERGLVVAEIRAARVKQTREEAALQALEQQGLVTIGRKRLRDFEPLASTPGKKTLSEMVIEDRE